MSWIKIDDRMPEHPKVVGLSDRAFRAHVEALCYCAGSLTDGFIPEAIAKARRWLRSVAALVTAGLWESVAGGWRIHDYLAHQRSKQDAHELSGQRSEAGAKGGRATAKGRQLAGDLLKQNASRSDEIRSDEIRSEEEEIEIPPLIPPHPDAREVYRNLADSLNVLNPPMGWAESWLKTRTLEDIAEAIGKARENGAQSTRYVDRILEKPTPIRAKTVTYSAPKTEWIATPEEAAEELAIIAQKRARRTAGQA